MGFHFKALGCPRNSVRCSMLPFSFFITSVFCVFIVLIKKHFKILVITKISKRKQSHLDSIINRENNGPGARLSKAPEASYEWECKLTRYGGILRFSVKFSIHESYSVKTKHISLSEYKGNALLLPLAPAT